MSARIRSLRNFITPIDEASRNDLVPTDIVTVQSLDGATTYAWALEFVPEGSTATFSGSLTAISPGSFTVDIVGPYLVRLTVDATLPTESTQYVRLRALTTTLGLRLVAAGERRDSTGIIPVDVDPVGWAYNQNFNLLALETATGVVETLAQTVAAGNTTGGTDIVLTSGDILRGQQGAALGGDVALRGGTPTSGVANGGNIDIRPGEGLGGGLEGYLHLQNGAGTQGVRISVPSADTIQIDQNVGGGMPLLYNTNTGKLTVPGVIDPTALILSDPLAGTELYIESADGQTAPVSAVGTGRIRYNDGTSSFETSVNGGAYTAIGGGAAESLAATLAVGNTSGGVDIILSAGDEVVGEGALNVAGDTVLRGGTATGGVADGGEVVLRPGTGMGGGVDGFIRLQNAAGTQGVRVSVSAADTIRFDKNAGGGLPLLYNTDTGKLTVPGLIDPTGVVFTLAGPPVTGASEGAIFVSDGTAGLTSGSVYTRGPSSATPAKVSAVLCHVRASNTSAQDLTTPGIVTNWTEAVDTASAFDATTGIFTAPATGIYRVSFGLLINVGGGGMTNYGSIRKNGTSIVKVQESWTFSVAGSIDVELAATDTIDIFATTSSVLGANADENWLSIVGVG